MNYDGRPNQEVAHTKNGVEIRCPFFALSLMSGVRRLYRRGLDMKGVIILSLEFKRLIIVNSRGFPPPDE